MGLFHNLSYDFCVFERERPNILWIVQPDSGHGDRYWDWYMVMVYLYAGKCNSKYV